MVVTRSREWREKTNSCSQGTTHRCQTHRFSTQVEAILLLYVWGNGGSARRSHREEEWRWIWTPGLRLACPWSLWDTHTSDKRNELGRQRGGCWGHGAFACLYLLLHLCVLTKVLDIKSEIKSGKWQSKWKKLKYFKAVFSFKSILANSMSLEKNSDNSS